MKNYIIGYGSLMNLKSLNRTLPSVDYIEPIHLKKFKRSWNAFENKTTSFSSTFLGIEKDENSWINAIFFEIENDLIPFLDKREFLYNRVEVDYKNITPLINSKFNFSENDKIWIYVTSNPKYPTNTNPIIQSYVDICISGSMDLEIKFNIKNFAQDFINSTSNWSKHWVNDRIFPRAPHIYLPYAYTIDKLLNENIPEYFKEIVIE